MESMYSIPELGSSDDTGSLMSSSKAPYVIMAVGFLFFFLMIYPYNEWVLPKPLVVFMGIVSLFALVFMAFSKFELLLIAFAVYIPFSREFPGDFGGVLKAFNLTNFMMIAIFLGILNKASLREERAVIRTPVDVPLVLFMVLGCISLFRASMMMQSESYFDMIIPMKQWMTPMIGYFLFLGALTDRDTAKKVAIVIMVSTTLIGVLTIKESIDMGEWSTWERSRVDGVFQHSNTLGAFFVYYSFLIAGVFLVYFREFRYWVTALPFLVCARGMMLTVSRGAIVSFAFAGIVVAFFRGKVWFMMAIFAIMVGVLFPQILPETISGRFYSMVEDEMDWGVPTYEKTLESSAQSRIDIIRGSRAFIKEHPFLGMGYGMHLYVVGIDTHNTFLKIAVEMGLIALFVFVILIAVIFFCTLYVYRHTDDKFMKAISLGFLGGLGGLAMCNFFGSRLDGTEFVAYFWILTAMMMKERHLLKQREALAEEKEERERECVSSTWQPVEARAQA